MDGASTAPPAPAPTRLAPFAALSQLARGPKLASDGRKLILAAVGIVIARAGWSGLDYAFGGRSLGVENEAVFGPGAFGLSFESVARSVAEPARIVIAPFTDLFALKRDLLPTLHAILASAWGVLVWGLIGGAIARITAVESALGERIGIRTALRFSARRAMALVGSPICPLIAIGFFSAICGAMGLLYRLPAGDRIAGALAFLPLLAGLVMALILVGLVVGWPLMIATVAVEAEDAFDAVSRSYSYVYQRSGLYALLVVLAWILGGIGWVFVRLFAGLVIHLAGWGLSIGAPSTLISTYFAGNSGDPSARSLHGFWFFVVMLLARAWLFSYFFTAATLIYTLLRRDVDGVSFSDLGHLDREPEPFAPELPARTEIAAKTETPEIQGEPTSA